MSDTDLEERLAYFEGKLAEAKRRSASGELHPRSFDAGYTTETFKTWADTIAVIAERLASIRRQLRLK
jgi:hypothetical protein